MNQPFVYKWTHTPTFKWYVGSRTKKDCHQNDGYICSSKIVYPLIIANPGEWKREIIFTGTAEEVYDFETMCLQLFDAKNDPRSYNGHNNDGKWTRAGTAHTTETKAKISAHNRNRAENNVKFRNSQKGKIRTPAHCEKISLAKKGNPQPIATCPHCNSTGSISNMKRWHFTNCKQFKGDK